MAVNKVVVGGETKIDLSADTVTPADLRAGATAHDSSGAQITGSIATYAGSTSVTPGTSAQTLQTAGMYLASDITVGAAAAVSEPGIKDVTFWDYDGSIVASWTLAELMTKTTLPDLPSHSGLICQGWNWSLADLKTTNRKMNVGAMYITDDGKTRIYIRLEEGRTSPMLGVCPNGTVTVDWGDGTTPDTLTGTSTTTVKWTPNHAYAAPGEYVIKLTVDGAMGFYGRASSNSGILQYSSGNDNRNHVYQNSVQKIEVGNGVTSISAYAFKACSSLASITIPNDVTSIKSSAFQDCSSLASITIPNGVTSIESYTVIDCSPLSSITIPNGVTVIKSSAVRGCSSLSSITIPNGVTSINYSAFTFCSSLSSITIPNGVTSIEGSTFAYCSSLASITILNGVTSIESNAFQNCYGVAFYDFTAYTTVPSLVNKTAFTGIAADCQIRVPASLVDAWKAATNWSTYADYIVGV